MTNSRTSRGPVSMMPGPGTGPRPGGWETLYYTTVQRVFIAKVWKRRRYYRVHFNVCDVL